MKNRILTIIALLFATFATAQVRPLEVEMIDKNSFSMIVLPDIQSYAKFEANHPILDLMTVWSAKHLDKLNVMSVLCTGDLVEHNELRIADGVTGDQTSVEQWNAVSTSFKKLDGKTPYVLCTGNHDYGYKSAENRMTNFHKYFQPERNSAWLGHLVEVANDSFGVPTLENAAYVFEDKNWGKLMVLSLEFAPRNEILEWAKRIAKKYSDYRIILLTHSYMETNASRPQKENYALENTNYGEPIWNKLVSVTPNIKFVLCGHACTIGGIEDTVSFRVDKNQDGCEIPQMMFNAQTADGEWFGNGGDGWLRILEFMPDGESVEVRTFSPLFGVSKLTVDKAWRRESYDQFKFKIAK